MQAAVPGTAVPNPFMSDFPTSGPQATNAAALGMFDQGATAAPGSGDIQPQGGDLFSAGGQADLFGSDSAMLKASDGSDGDVATGIAPGAMSSTSLASGKSTATPPPRPPPPASAVNGTPRAMSPAVGGASPGRPASASATASAASSTAQSKSAFDDLNDSIRMALGGSPSRPAPIAQQVPPVQQAQQPVQQGFAMFDMGGSMGGAGQPMMAGAPMVGYGVPPSQTQVPVGYGSPAKQPMSGEGTMKTTLLHARTVVYQLSFHCFLSSCPIQSKTSQMSRFHLRWRSREASKLRINCIGNTSVLTEIEPYIVL